jgi:hypothetical protein
MRKNVQDQRPIINPCIAHEHAEEIRNIERILDRLPLVDELIYEDLIRDIDDSENSFPERCQGCAATVLTGRRPSCTCSMFGAAGSRLAERQ